MSQPLCEAGGSFGRISLMDIDRPVAGHAHPQCHALFKIGGGDSLFEIDGREYPLADGTAVLVNSWQPHAYPIGRAECGHALVLALYIEPGWLEQIDRSFGSSARKDFFRAPCIQLPAAIAVLVRDLASELAAQWCDPKRAARLLETIMTELTVRYSRHREIPAWMRTASGAVSDHRIRKAMNAIAENVAAASDMDRIAREAALSRPHFFELFRRNVGVTPRIYRNTVRMEQAYRALLETDRPVTQIGMELGFSAHANFTRFFRENHGVAPEAFRRAAWRV